MSAVLIVDDSLAVRTDLGEALELAGFRALPCATIADARVALRSRLHSDREFTGTGIGLTTVRRIVERHGVRIWAEGSVGAGAKISFTIPPQRSAIVSESP